LVLLLYSSRKKRGHGKKREGGKKKREDTSENTPLFFSPTFYLEKRSKRDVWKRKKEKGKEKEVGEEISCWRGFNLLLACFREKRDICKKVGEKKRKKEKSRKAYLIRIPLSLLSS